MRVQQISLRNFRNYEQCQVTLAEGCNIFVGENAQGKTNLLEAVELLATGRSNRAAKDDDFIAFGADSMLCELTFAQPAQQHQLKVSMARIATASAFTGQSKTRLEKRISINGVQQKSWSDLLGRLLVVSFTANDLNLLRGGPSYRRDWLDTLLLKLRPRLAETISSYSRCTAQRNRLLKAIFDQGKVTVSDQDQLLAWDKQVANLGSILIKQRLKVLHELLPIAEEQQSLISRNHEKLSVRYCFKAPEQSLGQFNEEEEDFTRAPDVVHQLDGEGLAQVDEKELAHILMRLLKAKRAEEIRRKQTTVGPHRDDLIMQLNGADAVAFASQGQQRTIVLALKLAELTLVKNQSNETPVLLLDDVLAELDEFRQSMLMNVVEQGLQTLITTTHLSGFDPRWLENASVFKVHGGAIENPALV